MSEVNNSVGMEENSINNAEMKTENATSDDAVKNDSIKSISPKKVEITEKTDEPRSENAQADKSKEKVAEAESPSGGAPKKEETPKKDDKNKEKDKDKEKEKEKEKEMENGDDSDDKIRVVNVPKSNEPAATETKTKSPPSKGGQRAKSSRSSKSAKNTAEESAADEDKSEPKKSDVAEPEKSDVTPKGKSPNKGGQKRASPGDEEKIVKTRKAEKKTEPTDETNEEEKTDDKKTPSLEAPLIIEGKRQRTKTERLDSQMLSTPMHPKDVEVPQGSGAKLGDITYIEKMIIKTSVDDLKPLHRLMYGRAGSAHEIRKNLKTFCGFDFEKDTEAYIRKKKSLDNWTMKQVKKSCEVLGLERGGKKEDLEIVLIDFLLKPKDSGRQPPQSKRSKSQSGGKRKRSGAATSGKTDASATSGDESHSDAEAEGEGEEEEDLESEPKTKKAKKSTDDKAASSTSASPKRSPAKSNKKTAPSNDQLKATIKDLLKGANLEEVTMRDMCKQVSAKYPDFDLSGKKDFIKDTVKAVISSAD